MRCRLEKINHVKRQRRFYELEVVSDLFGDWCLRRTWGRLGSHGGRDMADYFDSFESAMAALRLLKDQKYRRGYGIIPVQLELFEWQIPSRAGA